MSTPLQPGATVDVEIELAGGARETIPVPLLLEPIPGAPGEWCPMAHTGPGGVPLALLYEGRRYRLAEELEAQGQPSYVDDGPASRSLD